MRSISGGEVSPGEGTPPPGFASLADLPMLGR